MSNDNNAPVPTLVSLMESKLANAKKRFAPVAEKYQLNDALEKLTVTDVAAALLSNRLVWTVLEAKETEFLLSIMLGAKTEETAGEVDHYVNAVKSLTPEELELAWRYVHFFLRCVAKMSE